ncbi:MAG: single-stranded DNA-binding protein [bacterium]
MARSLNKVLLIGNLTRDVELRYSPQGTPIAAFGIATNRQWKVGDQLKEAAEFHNIIAWNKLAELCAQLLAKGSRVYVEGRLQTRDWVDQSGGKHYRTEIVIDEMIFLGGKSNTTVPADEAGSPHADAPVSESSADDLVDLDIDEVLADEESKDK